MCLRSKLILSTLKLPQFIQMSLHHLIKMRSQRHHIKRVTDIMEPEFLLLRFYIFTRMKLWGQSHQNPSKIGICVWNIFRSYGWIRRFQSGKKDLRDVPRYWAPKLADDPHVSIHEIPEICYLSHGTIHRIIHEELGMKKMCAKWVPHFLAGATTKWI